MIEKALVCGQIAQALYKEEDRLFLLHAGETQKAIDCTPYEESLFFDSDSEIKIFENLSIDELRENILKEKRFFDALHHAIAGFDGNLSTETRILSMREAEALIKDNEVLSFVESRLFGNPVPREADLENAVKLSKKKSLQCMNILYFKMLRGSEILDDISASFKEQIFKYSLENKYTKIRNIFITSRRFAKLFFSAQMGIFSKEYSVPGNWADEKEIENVVNIYRSLRDNLERKYSCRIEDFGALLPQRRFIHESGKYIGFTKVKKTADMIKMSDPEPYGTLPRKKRRRPQPLKKSLL